MVSIATKNTVAQIGRTQRRVVLGVRATTRRLRGLSIMHHDIWNAITNTSPGLVGTILLAGFIGVMAWVWWPAGFPPP